MIVTSTLSHHLRRLIEAGLLTQERQATTLIYRAHYPAMRDLIGYMADEWAVGIMGAMAAMSGLFGFCPACAMVGRRSNH